MHFHKWGKFKFAHYLDRYSEGSNFERDQPYRIDDVFIAYCEKCGLPKKKIVKS